MAIISVGLFVAHLFLVTSSVSAASISFRYSGLELPPALLAYWGYDGPTAPEHWTDTYPSCGGIIQSPVNVLTHNVVPTIFPKKLKLINFASSIDDFVIVNNGHTAQVTVVAYKTPAITGGPLRSKYQLVQYHFHWGDNDTVGSENLLNGHSFPMEMHMVFWNLKYGNYSHATTHSDGLTVLALLFEISSADNPAFNFLDALANVVDAESETDYPQPPNLAKLLPSNVNEYYTLAGSLTTPPCSEIVTWIIVRQPIRISTAQVAKFRSLKNDDGDVIRHNFRPTQPLNGRLVYHNLDLWSMYDNDNNNL